MCRIYPPFSRIELPACACLLSVSHVFQSVRSFAESKPFSEVGCPVALLAAARFVLERPRKIGRDFRIQRIHLFVVFGEFHTVRWRTSRFRLVKYRLVGGKAMYSHVCFVACSRGTHFRSC